MSESFDQLLSKTDKINIFIQELDYKDTCRIYIEPATLYKGTPATNKLHLFSNKKLYLKYKDEFDRIFKIHHKNLIKEMYKKILNEEARKYENSKS